MGLFFSLPPGDSGHGFRKSVLARLGGLVLVLLAMGALSPFFLSRATDDSVSRWMDFFIPELNTLMTAQPAPMRPALDPPTPTIPIPDPCANNQIMSLAG